MAAFDKILLSDGVTELANVKRVTSRETVNAGQDLAPGCVSSASIEVEVFGVQATAVQGGDTLYYYQVDENNTDTLIGEFTAEPVIKSKGTYKFTAYDNARKLDADFSAWLADHQSSFPMSVYTLTVAACTVAGVTLQNASFPNSSQQVNAFYANGLTCRDIVSYAAEIAGQFAKCDANGELSFAWYNSFPGYRIYPSSGQSGAEIRVAYKQDGLSYSNYTVPAVDHVAVHPSGVDDAAYVYPTTGVNNVVLHVRNNLLLTGADSSFYNAVAQRVYTAMSAVGAYRSFSANMFPKESPFRAGDIVSVTDIQGVSFTAPVMSLMTTNAVATLSATGNEVREDKANTDRAIAQLNADVVRINKLKVDWADIDQAIINVVEANELKSSDFLDSYGVYAAQGMSVDLASKTIKATQFAVDGNGKLYASAAEISHFEFDDNSTYVDDTYTGEVYDVGGLDWLVFVRVPITGIQTIFLDGVTGPPHYEARYRAYYIYREGETVILNVPNGYVNINPVDLPSKPDNADSVSIGFLLKAEDYGTARLHTRRLVSGSPSFTSPSGANVTFTDGISVDGVTLDSSFLNSLIPGQKATVSAGGSNTINIGLDTRGVLFTSSRSTAHRGAYLWVSAPSGNFVITPILTASSLNITGASGVMTITSTASSGYAAYALCISF